MRLIPAHQTRPSDDPIFALNSEATERRKKGESIVNATVGALLDDDGKLSVLPTAARALREVPELEWATYAPIAGAPAFLNAVLDDFFASEPALRAMAVGSATPGGSGALRQALDNFLEPGQSLLSTSYYWGPYQTLCDESGRKLETFAMFDKNGGLDVNALDVALGRILAAQGRALLFLNDPCHNPTGYSMTDDEWRAVVEILRKHGKTAPVTLLVDTAYFAYGTRGASAFLPHVASLAGDVGLLFAWSASKTFTHYGLRVGALLACVADEKERRATDAALSYTSRGTWSNCNRGGMFAVGKLLSDATLRAACDTERNVLRERLLARVAAFNAAAATKKLTYPRYDGGFFVTMFAADAEDRARRMREAGVYVVPSKGAVRVALCSVAERDIVRLVEALSI